METFEAWKNSIPFSPLSSSFPLQFHPPFWWRKIQSILAIIYQSIGLPALLEIYTFLMKKIFFSYLMAALNSSKKEIYGTHGYPKVRKMNYFVLGLLSNALSISSSECFIFLLTQNYTYIREWRDKFCKLALQRIGWCQKRCNLHNTFSIYFPCFQISSEIIMESVELATSDIDMLHYVSAAY